MFFRLINERYEKKSTIVTTNADLELQVKVTPDKETVWLNKNQLATLFEHDTKTIGKHIDNALKEELDTSVVAKFATTTSDGKTYKVDYYNLDMIISVGYRVKSKKVLLLGNVLHLS